MIDEMLFKDLDKHMSIVKDANRNRFFLLEGGDRLNLKFLFKEGQYTYFKELDGNHMNHIIVGCTESSRKCSEIIHRYKNELEVKIELNPVSLTGW
ncbi:hypothetical protein ig2599ANME_0662 [groundwater metagenome]